MQPNIAIYEQKFRERGLALTIQRRIILAELLARLDHPTADQIFASVRDRVPGLSKTTVYRVLETLVSLGMARKVMHADAAVRFDPNVARHHHLVCEICGTLVDLADDDVANLSLPETEQHGFTIKNYTINFSGVCAGCSDGDRSLKHQKGEEYAGP